LSKKYPEALSNECHPERGLQPEPSDKALDLACLLEFGGADPSTATEACQFINSSIHPFINPSLPPFINYHPLSRYHSA
jgi:hypothetical protein